MKLFIILAAVTLAQADKLDRTYLPPNAQASAGSAFLQSPHTSNGFQSQSTAYSNGFSNPNTYAQTGAYSGYESRPERAQAAFERNAAILRQDNANDGETYAYAYETENGIYAEENGVATNGVQAQGGYTYTGDDGKVYSVRYTADENGFQPQGDHLPTSPPIPEEILKSLEQNAREEAAGIYNDGSFNDGKYSSNSQQQYYNNADSIVTNNAYLRNDASQSSSSVAGVQKAYLPPFAGNNQKIGARQPFSHASQSSSSIAGVQKAYLPPFMSNQKIGVRQPTFSDASHSSSSIAGVQKAYLPPFMGNQKIGVRQPTFNDASQSSVNRVQKAYLPPFAGNNKRIGMRQPIYNNIAQSGSSIAGVQKQYLPPFAQRNGLRQPTFNAKDGYRY